MEELVASQSPTVMSEKIPGKGGDPGVGGEKKRMRKITVGIIAAIVAIVAIGILASPTIAVGIAGIVVAIAAAAVLAKRRGLTTISGFGTVRDKIGAHKKAAAIIAIAIIVIAGAVYMLRPAPEPAPTPTPTPTPTPVVAPTPTPAPVAIGPISRGVPIDNETTLLLRDYPDTGKREIAWQVTEGMFSYGTGFQEVNAELTYAVLKDKRLAVIDWEEQRVTNYQYSESWDLRNKIHWEVKKITAETIYGDMQRITVPKQFTIEQQAGWVTLPITEKTELTVYFDRREWTVTDKNTVSMGVPKKLLEGDRVVDEIRGKLVMIDFSKMTIDISKKVTEIQLPTLPKFKGTKKSEILFFE